MTAKRVADLAQAERRRAIIRMTGRVTLTSFIILGAYFLLPVHEQSGPTMVLRLLLGLALLGFVVAWQVREIRSARLPELRAVEAVAVAIPLFLVIFAATYVSLSAWQPRSFTQPIDQVAALYFTITVFATVGFGDITPVTHFARLLVSTQMIADLIIIGLVVRVLLNAARTGLQESGAGGDEEAP